MTLKVGTAISVEVLDAEVFDAEDQPHRLGDALAGDVVLLVFLRHFGCTGCAQQLDVLVPHLSALGELGVHTVLVGNGEPEHLRAFLERQRLEGYPLRAFTDPTVTVHRAAGLSRSAWLVFGPTALAREVVVRTQGYTSGSKEGDVLQSGGVAIIRDGEVTFFQQARVAAEPVPAPLIVDAAIAAVGRGMVDRARIARQPVI